MPDFTPWFPGDVKPARPGVYQRKYGAFQEETGYSRWDGKRWYFRATTPEMAARDSTETINPHRAWRGLAEEPKHA
jgi:hypothetical protein